MSLAHPPTKHKLDYGRSIAKEFHDVYNLVTDEKVVAWLIELRPDLCKGLSKDELSWLLVQIKEFKDYLWGRS